MIPRLRSFRVRLFAAGALALLAMAVAQTLSQAALVRDTLQAQLEVRALDERPFFGAALANPLIERDYASIAQILRESRSERGLAYLVLVDARGRLIAAEGWDVPRHGVPARGTPALAGPDAPPVLPYELPIRYAGQDLGMLYFGLSTAPVRDALAGLALRSGLVTLGSLLLGGLLMELCHYWLTRPLVRLRAATDAIRAGDFAVALPAERPDDIGALTAGFRRMATEIEQRIAALVESQQALRAAKEQAEAATAAKDQLLASIGHELRTPLSAAGGFAQLLRAQAQVRAEPELSALADEIALAVARLTRLVEQVLGFAALDLGHIELRTEPVPVTTLLTELEAAMGPLAARTGVHLLVEPVPAGIPDLMVDRARTHEILDALVHNAIVYNRPGGIVIVSALLHAGLVRLMVGDNGPGIAPERQAELFQPFRRLGAEAGPIEGAGLSLAAARLIARAMGGQIGFHSAPRQGSRFWIDLPGRNGPAVTPVDGAVAV